MTTEQAAIYLFDSTMIWLGMYFIRIQGTVVLQTSQYYYHVATEYLFWYQYNALPYSAGLFHKATSPVMTSWNAFSDWRLLQGTSDKRQATAKLPQSDGQIWAMWQVFVSHRHFPVIVTSNCISFLTEIANEVRLVTFSCLWYSRVIRTLCSD